MSVQSTASPALGQYIGWFDGLSVQTLAGYSNPARMNFIAALGKTLFALRQDAKLSQEQLAHEAGVYRNTIGLIERGEMSVSVQTLDQICDALGYRPWQLMLEAEFLMDAAEAEGAPKSGRQMEPTAVAMKQAAIKLKRTAASTKKKRTSEL